MSKLSTKKHGSSSFGSINTAKKGTLTPEEWAVIMVEEGFPASRKIIAEGLGIINRESGFNSDPGGDGAHYGAWQEDSSFGSVSQRLDPHHSTRTARARWAADGHSFFPAWGRWQLEQGGIDGATQYANYMTDAANGIKRAGGESSSGGGGGWIGGVPDPGDLLEGAESAVGGVVDAGEFLAEMAETLLDFRKLGQLAVEAFAWGLRLLLKAIWDYVIAPVFHWTERAVVWYGENFYGTGTEQGSGFGAQLRANAGIVTIAFWAIGYGVLWTDGESLSPSISANNSMAGKAVKGVEGKIARRNLVKPSKVKEKTPDKPKAKASTVQIERAQTFSVGRKRPVSVTSSSQPQVELGRNTNGSSQRQTPASAPVERPQQNPQQIHLPAGVERPAVQQQKQTKKGTLKLTAKQGGTGVGSRGHSRSGA